MKNLRRKFDLYCYKNRNKGIPNLMLYIVLGTAIVYLMSQMSGNYLLYNILCFDRQLILQGQVWRLITFIFEPPGYGLLTPFLILFYYWIGRSLEYYWGTTRFNLYYLFGILGAVLGAFLTGATGTSEYLNLSLLLAWVALFPDMQVLLLGLIPFKLKWLGWIEGVYLALNFLAGSWPSRVALLLSMANFLLFFGPTLWNRLRRSWPRRY